MKPLLHMRIPSDWAAYPITKGHFSFVQLRQGDSPPHFIREGTREWRGDHETPPGIDISAFLGTEYVGVICKILSWVLPSALHSSRTCVAVILSTSLKTCPPHVATFCWGRTERNYNRVGLNLQQKKKAEL